MIDTLHDVWQFIKDNWAIITAVISAGYLISEKIYGKVTRKRVRLELSNSDDSSTIFLCNESALSIYVDRITYCMREYTVPKEIAKELRAFSPIGKTINPGEKLPFLKSSNELFKMLEDLNRHQLESIVAQVKNYNLELYPLTVFCDVYVIYRPSGRQRGNLFKRYDLKRVLHGVRSSGLISIEYPISF